MHFIHFIDKFKVPDKLALKHLASSLTGSCVVIRAVIMEFALFPLFLLAYLNNNYGQFFRKSTG
jgi:hypothetical protein